MMTLGGAVGAGVVGGAVVGAWVVPGGAVVGVEVLEGQLLPTHLQMLHDPLLGPFDLPNKQLPPEDWHHPQSS